MMKYKIGYQYLFLSSNTLTDSDSDDMIDCLSIDVLFDNIFEAEEPTEKAILTNDGKEHYLSDLVYCFVNKDNTLSLKVQRELFQKLTKPSLSFRVVGYFKEKVGSYGELVPVSIEQEEFENLLSTGQFNNSTNNPAQVPSYFIEKIGH